MSAKSMSLSAYARRRGVSAKAVSKAVADGRLSASIVREDGQPKIGDPDLADREWGENTRARIQPTRSEPKSKPQRSTARKRRKSAATGGDDGEVPNYETSRAWREAHAARREGALADLAELDAAERRDELVPADEVRAYIEDKFTVIKTRFLGIPSRVAQQLPPDVASSVARLIERFIDEVLQELAAEDDGDGDEEEES